MYRRARRGSEEKPKEPFKMKFDSVLPMIGEFGPYQRRIYALVCLPTICCAMHKLAWVFLGAKVSFRCKLPVEWDNATYDLPEGVFKNMTFLNDEKEQCSRYNANFSGYPENLIPTNEQVGCGGEYVYDLSKYESSAFMEFGLMCDRKALYATAQALFMVGILLGSIIFGVLSDIFGRRPVFFFSLVIQVVFGILAGVAPDYTTFVIARIIVGASTSGIFLVGFVIAMEMVGPSKRVIAGVVCQYFFTAGYLVTGTMAYLIKDWRHLQIALSVPGVVLLSYWWFLPESIRWLLTRGRKAEANAILRKVAVENKVTLPEEVYDGLCDDDKKETNTVNFLRVLQFPKLRLRSANIFLNWFVNSGVYYGLSLNTSSLGGNDYINFLISGAVEVPAYTFLLLSLNRLGRKYVLCGCMLAGGFFMAICGAIPENLNWLLITSSMIGKLCITASYGVIYILSAENFPTVVRNAGMGASSMFARVGGILAAYIVELGDFWKPLPLLIFGGASIIGGGLALFIPETLGKRLPETLEDGEKFGTASYEKTKIHRELESWLTFKNFIVILSMYLRFNSMEVRACAFMAK
ncbi:unnamed protein product [Allacma fusca]|uniref:Major facilitator superfamily (MFS) profile domain-containing protein n=1 Tax=Allacma fusca TaxID=39272 RepID=A0A8J2PHZ6_9HEXA|nr:unnamed protein product [Allacma fusca]